MGGTQTGLGPVGLSGNDRVDKGTRALVCNLPPPIMNMANRLYAFVVSMEPRRKGDSAKARAAFNERYGIFLQIGPTDVDADIRRARKMSRAQLIDAVRTGGNWDFKNRKEYIDVARGNSELKDRLQEFGNFYFGLMFAARGLGLYATTLGAGAYQVFNQSIQRGKLTGSPAGLLEGLANADSVTLGLSFRALENMAGDDEDIQAAIAQRGSNSRARQLIGCSDSAMGDNPGDSAAIMRGWDFFFLRQGYAPPP